jgi:hypothetical protein
MCSKSPECINLVTSLSRAAAVKFMDAWNACGMTAALYSGKRMVSCDVQEIQWASHMATVEKKAVHTEF